ncbi:DUF4160 domain-containing protein [Lysobacter sp. A6]|uniref:DUF4160 domain-containing protein n=2 Tax=Noviluteimonas lactosilytica TaxID=2888523 RepID=A0ABS8JEG6_9GAMM|nr:DUF4160 domain-containing protein [Lysobacter lactosilyticus]
MPTVLRFLSYRVVIYPNDHTPCHVHVVGNGYEAVFELNCPDGPPVLKINHNFPRRTLGTIQSHLSADLAELCKQWSDIHGRY